MKKITYRKEIDGLRALAVLGVVLFHFDLLGFSGGFFGVDVFFVISGYLISSLLFAEVDRTGTISISGFYQRRARRILPALLAICLATYFLFVLVTHSWQSPFPHYGGSLVAALFSVSNVYFWLHAGYFAIDAWAEPLLHTWTLGVEEQFYLVIPLLLYWLSRSPREIGRRKRYWVVCLSLALVSFCLCRYGRDIVDPYFNFYMLPSRMWELLIGILVALTTRRFNTRNLPFRWLNELLALLGIALVIYGFLSFYESTRIAEKALVITGGTALFLLFVTPRTLIGKLFSSSPLVFTGKISYSWYLWHWPFVSLSVMLPIKFPMADAGVLRIGVIAASYLLAILTWRYVEAPFRKIKTWAGCIRPLAPLFLLLVVLGVAQSLGVMGKAAYSFEKNLADGISILQPAGGSKGLLGVAGKPPSFALIGNSHTQVVAPVLSVMAKEKGFSGIAVTDGIDPFLDMIYVPTADTNQPNRAQLIAFLKRKHISTVLIVARYDHLLLRARDGLMRYKGEKVEPGMAENVYREAFRNLFTELVQAGIDVWIMEQVPLAQVDPTVAVRVRNEYTEPARPEPQNDIIREIAATMGGNVHVITPRPFFVKSGRYVFTEGNHLLYFDEDHLSAEGAEHMKDVFIPFLARLSD